ncbi:hypothetical protein OO013_19890 [Mangrovivirga sp. M17]|uniref:Uncharacterized protein n=1 Tax=Mangrovivirga halotolerans TaxID=2993936 RepID=A0ABT3RX68_9BACT|nr:hypothetical protein [Mangrovivirga halotolerans]MCX2746151.1 hypothetical protein [Mangrovivirga halotolerans]
MFFIFTGNKLYETPDIIYSDNQRRIEIVETAPGMGMSKTIFLINEGRFLEKKEKIEDFGYDNKPSYNIDVFLNDKNQLRIVGQLNEFQRIDKTIN